MGTIVMEKSDYIHKMTDILSVYRKVTRGEGKMEAARCKKKARDLLLQLIRGKRLLHLLKKASCYPNMRGWCTSQVY